MKKPHKHAELIKAWADGAEIEYLNTTDDKWQPIFKGWSWDASFHIEMRIKPEPKPDLRLFYLVTKENGVQLSAALYSHNLVISFDGETGKLKSAEVL